tara:strand:- start:170 stop:871 length:702 start_codon:yes stop_codon:yes gene_type:complete
MAKGQRENFHTVRYGTRDGEIQFGHIHQDNNESAVMLRSGHDWLHYITMDHTGDPVRKHSTICRSPGSFQVKAGDNARVTNNNLANDAGITLDAVSGDIIIRAPRGKLRIEAQDIELLANGYNGNTGYIRLDSNEKIILKSKSVDVRGTESAKFFSEKTLDVIGNSIMNIYGGLMDFADGATKLRGSKCGPSSTEENAKKLKDENASAMRDQFAAEAEQEAWQREQDATTGGT